MANALIAAKAAKLAKKNPAKAALLLRLDAAETGVQVLEALDLYDQDVDGGTADLS
jgi:hypothetical protein